MKYSAMNEEVAAVHFEERKKKLLENLKSQQQLVQKKSKPKYNILTVNQQTKSNISNQLNTNQSSLVVQNLETTQNIGLKNIVKNSLLKDIGNLDIEIQRMSRENVTQTNLELYSKLHKSNNSNTQNQKQLKPQQSYFSNRQHSKPKQNSQIENSYSLIAASVRNVTQHKVADEIQESKNNKKPYNFLQLKSSSETRIEKPIQKSVRIDNKSIILEKKQNNLISSERKTPLKQIQNSSNKNNQTHSALVNKNNKSLNQTINNVINKNGFTKREKPKSNGSFDKINPLKSILKWNSQNTLDIGSSTANTTSLFYSSNNQTLKLNEKLDEAISLYKTLKQLMITSNKVNNNSLLANNFTGQSKLNQPNIQQQQE